MPDSGHLPWRSLKILRSAVADVPYTGDRFASIWQQKMKSAVAQGVLKDRFTDHDLRAKSGSETDIEHAERLLAHNDRKTTHRQYRRKSEKVKPLR